MKDSEVVEFMNYQWFSVDGDLITVGLTEDAVSEFDSITNFVEPEESVACSKKETVGEIETEDGILSIYSPVDGTIVEINQEVMDKPDIILEDPYSYWLFRIRIDETSSVGDIAAGMDDDNLDDDDIDDFEEAD